MPHFDPQFAQDLMDRGLSSDQVREVFDALSNNADPSGDDPVFERQTANAEEDRDELEALKQVQADAIERGDLRGAMRAAVGQLQFQRRHSG